MPEESTTPYLVERVRDIVDALDRSDLESSIVAAHARGDYSSSEWAHPDIEYSIVGGLFSGDWKGRAAMARAARELFSTWKGHRSLVDEVRPLDHERVLVLSHVIARA